MTRIQSLQNDIKNFILSNNSISHRTHLLNDILIDYFSTLDDDTIQEYEDYMFPIMEALEIDRDSDYAEGVDTLVDNMKSTK